MLVSDAREERDEGRVPERPLLSNQLKARGDDGDNQQLINMNTASRRSTSAGNMSTERGKLIAATMN